MTGTDVSHIPTKEFTEKSANVPKVFGMTSTSPVWPVRLVEFKYLLLHLSVLTGCNVELVDIVQRSRLVWVIVTKFCLWKNRERTLCLLTGHMKERVVPARSLAQVVPYLQRVRSQQSVSDERARQSTGGYIFTELQTQQVPTEEEWKTSIYRRNKQYAAVWALIRSWS